MKTVTLEVRAPEEGMDEFVQAWRSGKAQRAARIGFATPELLWKLLSAKRWELLKALCGAGLPRLFPFPCASARPNGLAPRTMAPTRAPRSAN